VTLANTETTKQRSRYQCLYRIELFLRASLSDTVHGARLWETGEFFTEPPWVLSAMVSKNLENWDLFIYFPDQEYPERGFGGVIERLGAWAYVHE